MNMRGASVSGKRSEGSARYLQVPGRRYGRSGHPSCHKSYVLAMAAGRSRNRDCPTGVNASDPPESWGERIARMCSRADQRIIMPVTVLHHL